MMFSMDLPLDPTLIAVIALGILFVLLVAWIFILEQRLKKLTSGKDGASLESTIAENKHALEELFELRDDVKNEMGRLNQRIKKKLHGVKMIRFNPFHGTGTGGNQSFAAALLDEEGNGVVLSTLYSREKVSVFAKPVVNRTSEFELTDEEREVLKS